MLKASKNKNLATFPKLKLFPENLREWETTVLCKKRRSYNLETLK